MEEEREGGREGYRDGLCCYEALLLCSAALWIFLRKSGVAEGKKRVTHTIISWTAVVQQQWSPLTSISDPADSSRWEVGARIIKVGQLITETSLEEQYS